MFIRSCLAGIAGAAIIMAAGANSASAQCGPGCDGPANWSGLYVGVGVGGNFDMMGQDWELYTNPAGVLVGQGNDSYRGGAGFIGTVSLGYDWHVRDRLVLGAFTDFDFGTTEHTEKDTWYGSGTPSTGYGQWTIEHNNTWTIGGRLGLLTTNTAMVYGLLGYSQANVDVTLHVENDTPASQTFSNSDTYHGFTVGAGLEQELGNGFFLKGEYRYTDFDDVDFGTHTELDGLHNEHDSFDLDSHSIRASLVYKFAREHAVEEVSYKDVPPAAPYK